MVARERGERQIRQCLRIDPQHLFNLRSRFDGAFDVDGVHRGAHLKTRLVGCCAIELAKCLRAIDHHATAQFFGNLAREGGHIVFAGVALAARLHESEGPALADQQDTSISVADQSGHYTNHLPGHSSSPEKSPNWAGSRAGSGKPRCWKANPVSRRPRGVRCRKPFWIKNGSMMSSIASRGSDSAAARVSTPTGPPP